MATKLWAWVFSCLLILACGGWLVHSATHGWTESKVRRLSEAKCPSLGSDRETVKQWLKSNPFSDPNGPSIASDRPGLYYCRDVGLDPTKLSSDALSIGCPDPNVGVFCFGEMEIFFYFDKNDKLVRVYVRPWVAGPGL
jgi:hypothetical protein